MRRLSSPSAVAHSHRYHPESRRRGGLESEEREQQQQVPGRAEPQHEGSVQPGRQRRAARPRAVSRRYS